MQISAILVPIDGSASADRALEFAADLAQRYDSTLVLAHVQAAAGRATTPEGLEGLERSEHVQVTEAELLHGAAEQLLERARRIAEKNGVRTIASVHGLGDPATQLAEIARERRVDLIVMGRRGVGRVQGLVFGSVSYKLMHLADCACLTVR